MGFLYLYFWMSKSDLVVGEVMVYQRELVLVVRP